MQSVLLVRQWWASYRIVCGNLFVFFWKQKTLGEYFGEKKVMTFERQKEKHSTVISFFFFFPQTLNLQCLGSILLSAIFFPLLFLQENFNMNFVMTCGAQELPWFPPACTVPVPCPSGTGPLCVVPWITSWIMSFCWSVALSGGNGLILLGSCQKTQSHQLGQPWNSLVRCQVW